MVTSILPTASFGKSLGFKLSEYRSDTAADKFFGNALKTNANPEINAIDESGAKYKKDLAVIFS
ncbi:hypothetical protein [Pelagibius sp. Alg239-R121]|uniref:hypothetical protein n=1 Tax=Pelagibius sp. Alg239-R121 TaxID=2993448 RepID=UPI0024A77A4B|nr:hypothetical protein [Pelagibius sp. Alg239-R121]